MAKLALSIVPTIRSANSSVVSAYTPWSMVVMANFLVDMRPVRFSRYHNGQRTWWVRTVFPTPPHLSGELD
jgi:hypothetical protein